MPNIITRKSGVGMKNHSSKSHFEGVPLPNLQAYTMLYQIENKHAPGSLDKQVYLSLIFSF